MTDDPDEFAQFVEQSQSNLNIEGRVLNDGEVTEVDIDNENGFAYFEKFLEHSDRFMYGYTMSNGLVGISYDTFK